MSIGKKEKHLQNCHTSCECFLPDRGLKTPKTHVETLRTIITKEISVDMEPQAASNHLVSARVQKPKRAQVSSERNDVKVSLRPKSSSSPHCTTGGCEESTRVSGRDDKALPDREPTVRDQLISSLRVLQHEENGPKSTFVTEVSPRVVCYDSIRDAPRWNMGSCISNVE